MDIKQFVAYNNGLLKKFRSSSDRKSPFVTQILTIDRINNHMVYFTNGDSCVVASLIHGIVAGEGCIRNPSKLVKSKVCKNILDNIQPIVTVCYGNRREWLNRREALAFYSEAVENSDGCEKQRYMKICMDLSEGKSVCTDT